MKRIILFFWSLFLLNISAFAKEAGKEAPPEVTIKPIKVSEINANLFSAIYDFFRDIKQDIFDGLLSLRDCVETEKWLVKECKVPATQYLFEAFIPYFAVSLVLGWGISYLTMLWLKPKLNHFLSSKSYFKSNANIQGILVESINPLLFGFLFYSIFRAISPHTGVYLETIQILSTGTASIWLLLNIAHVFLRPTTPKHQRIPLRLKTLNKVYVWIRRMAFVALFGFFTLNIGHLIHLPDAGERLLLQTTTLAIILMATFMAFAFRKDLKVWIKKQRDSIQRARLKRSLLPYLEHITIPLIVLISISYTSWVSSELDRFQIIVWKVLLTLALLPFAQYMAYCLKKVRILYVHRNLKRLSAPFSQQAIFYGQQVDTITRTILLVSLILFAFYLWGFDPYQFIFSKIGKTIFEKAFGIFTIIIVALFLSRAGTGLLNKYLSTKGGDIKSETHKQKMARLKTIHSVSRNLLRIVIWTPAILLIIVELDIPILPILAPVTIVAAAVGFGMQPLVKDFFTGFFMLLEDAFAVGDLVIINGQMGRIESLTVRVVRLRATDGSLFTFPYGSISTLCNQNRDFSAVVTLFHVGIDADINQVYEVLEKISKDLRKDPKTRPLVIEPIQIDGVNEVSDHAIEIRAIIKTKPSMHYRVKWAFNLLLKQYLAEYNIPSATPREISYNYALEK